jgi:hypothetical protein
MFAAVPNTDQDLFFPQSVRILRGCSTELVGRRSRIAEYETNNEIKYWATWFLLKGLSDSGCIKQWTKQKPFILNWVKMRERTFRTQLSWLVKERLLMIDKHTHSIRLVSYYKAAQILGIEYRGVYSINYEPNKYNGKQSFRFFLIAEEFRYHQQQQSAAIMLKLDNNPALRKDLICLLTKEGCDNNRLQTQPDYFIERLLQLQIRFFKDGSDILAYVFTLRADTNRGVKKIQKDHNYRSPQSVSYLKRCMFRRGIIKVQKICVESSCRSRIYFRNKQTGSHEEGYKWLATSKNTAFFLCDQVKMNYEVIIS